MAYSICFILVIVLLLLLITMNMLIVYNYHNHNMYTITIWLIVIYIKRQKRLFSLTKKNTNDILAIVKYIFSELSLIVNTKCDKPNMLS